MKSQKLKKVINRNVIAKLLIFTSAFLFAQKVGAVSFIFETKKNYFKEREFEIKIKIDPQEKVVYAVKTEISFDPDVLELVEINKENSIITLWIEEPKISSGKISFAGGIPNGFRGIFLGTPLEANELIAIKFKKKKEILKEEIEKKFLFKGKIFFLNEGIEVEEKEEFIWEEKDHSQTFEDFIFLSGILYNGIKWKVEKIF